MPKYKSKTKDCQLIVRAKFSSNEKINERELNFFSRKYIRGLMRAEYKKSFRFTGIEYTGPIGISLYERLSKNITKYDFFMIVEQVADLVRKLQMNGMNIKKLDWRLQNVFINEMTRELQFIYLPLETELENNDVMEFLEKIIYSSHFEKQEADSFITEFTYFIKNLKNFDVDKIEQYVQKQDKSIVQMIQRHGIGQSGYMTDKPGDYWEHYNSDEEATGLLEEEATMLLQEHEYEETALLDEDATTLLDENANVHFPFLIRTITDEKILINKPVFRLGKERSYSDYFVSNNSAVSRSHADIITRGNKFYIIDLNSKNKTYINDQQIPIHKEIDIRDGDCLRLANEEFIFYE